MSISLGTVSEMTKGWDPGLNFDNTMMKPGSLARYNAAF